MPGTRHAIAIHAALILLLSGLSVFPTHAQEFYRWTDDAADDEWFLADNWTGGDDELIPTINDDVLISQGESGIPAVIDSPDQIATARTVTIGLADTPGFLIVSGPGTLNVAQAIFLNNGDLSIVNGGQVTVGAGIVTSLNEDGSLNISFTGPNGQTISKVAIGDDVVVNLDDPSYIHFAEDLIIIGEIDGSFAIPESTIFVGLSDSGTQDFELFVPDTDFAEPAQTANQRAVGAALNALATQNKMDLDLFKALVLSDTAQIQSATDSLSGEFGASIKSALFDNAWRRLQTVKTRMGGDFQLDAGATAKHVAAAETNGAPKKRKRGPMDVWITGYGGWADTDSDVDASKIHNNAGGILAGVERGFGKNGQIGLFTGYERNNITDDSRIATAIVDTWSLGFMADRRFKANTVSVGAAASWNSVNSSRYAYVDGELIGFGELEEITYDSSTWQIFAEAGRMMRTKRFDFEPFGAVHYVSLETDAFTESGSAVGLSAASDRQNVTFATAGLRTSVALSSNLHTRGLIAWRFASGDTDPSAEYTFPNVDDSFIVTGVPVATSAFVSSFDLAMKISDKLDTTITYLGQYGDGTTAHGLAIGLNARF